MKNNQQIAKLVSDFLRDRLAAFSEEMAEVGLPVNLDRMIEESIFEVDGEVRISLEHGLPYSYYDGYNSLVQFTLDLGEAHDLLVEIQNPGCLVAINA